MALWADVKCMKCGQFSDGHAKWGRSPLCFRCLGERELLVTAAGAVIDPATPAREKIYAARYRYRAVYCGKRCRGCPHKIYVYRVWRVDGVAREKYIGRADEIGDDYESPELA